MKLLSKNQTFFNKQPKCYSYSPKQLYRLAAICDWPQRTFIYFETVVE